MRIARSMIIGTAALLLAASGASAAGSAVDYAPIFTIASVAPKAAPLSAFVRSRACNIGDETLADNHKNFVQSIVNNIVRDSPKMVFPATFPTEHDARSEFVVFYHKMHHGFVLEIQTLKTDEQIMQTMGAIAACTSLGTGTRAQIEKVGLYVRPKTHAGIFFSSDAGYYVVQPDAGD